MQLRSLMDPVCIALLGVLVTIVCWFCAQRAWRFSLFKRLGIPGPSPSFIYGNLEELLGKGMGATFDDWTTKYGDIVGYFHGSVPAVLTSDPEMIKQVFVRDGKTITERQVFTLVTKPLLLNQVRLTRVFGQDWKELRGLISPAFKGSYMKQAVIIMKDRASLFADMIEVAAAKQDGVVNMHDHVLRLAMDVAMGVFHGTRTDVQRGDEAACKLLLKCRQCTGMFGESKMVLINSISELPFLFKPLLKYGLSRGVPMDTVLAYFGPRFEERRRINGAKKADLLQILLNAESEDSPQINFEPVKESKSGDRKVHLTCRTRTLANGTLFIIAAIDAVATPLTFATYLLAMHQDVQDRLRQEVREAMTKDGELTYDNICGMEYLGQVISEALRMYPSLHGFVQRACDQDYEYKGIRFPKDTVIGVPVLRMHYDPKFWSEPEKFNPDRFSSENKHKITPMAYLPFGAGPRNCIASRYSELIMRVTLATLVSRHKLTPSEGEPKTAGSFRASFILLVPDKGIWLRTEKLSTA
ncbi:cytochrome P450 3A31-like isoform X2 [Amblyomma americanum]